MIRLEVTGIRLLTPEDPPVLLLKEEAGSRCLPIWIGTTGIWFAAPIGYILGIIPLLIYYYSGRWKKLLTVPAAEPAKA